MVRRWERIECGIRNVEVGKQKVGAVFNRDFNWAGLRAALVQAATVGCPTGIWYDRHVAGGIFDMSNSIIGDSPSQRSKPSKRS